MSTTKPSRARKALADVAEKVAALDLREREHAMKYEAARRRVEQSSAVLTEHVEEGAVSVDGTAGDDAERKLHAELAKADAAVRSPQWAAAGEGFRRARQRLNADRERLTAEHFDDLVAELVAEAKALRDDQRAWTAGREAFALADLQRRHAGLRAAWLVLERDAGMSLRSRLDVDHEFAVQIVGDPDALAVPKSALHGDPTIVAPPAPALAAGGGARFLPLDD